MVNAQEYLNKKYSRKEKREAPKLEIDNKNLEGHLDLSGFISLKTLNCASNKITSLNLRENKKLSAINCSYNQLTVLDISNNVNLTNLICDSNQISNLDLSNNSRLVNLQCPGNQLTNLDLSNNKQLKRIECQSNQLISLNLENNKILEDFSCVNNKLSELDLSKNAQLVRLLCSINKITKLDLTNNLKLLELDCWDNPLDYSTDIKISEKIDYFGGYPLFFLIPQRKEVFQVAVNKEWNKLVEKPRKYFLEMILVNLPKLNSLVADLSLQNIKDKEFLSKHFPQEQIGNITNGFLSLRIMLDNLANRIFAYCLIIRNRLLEGKDEEYENDLISLSLQWQQCGSILAKKHPKAEDQPKVVEKIRGVLRGDKELISRLDGLDFVSIPKFDNKS